jgi:hypothetical protein
MTLLLHLQGYAVAPSRKMGCVQLKRLSLLKKKLYERRIGGMIAMATGRFLQGRSGTLLQVIRRKTSKGRVLFGGGCPLLASWEMYPLLGNWLALLKYKLDLGSIVVQDPIASCMDDLLVLGESRRPLILFISVNT